MESTEEFYRTLCSLETLRSGKKGFFCDFSDCVMSVVGEQWISKVFGRLSNDEDRIRTIFTDNKIKATVVETLSRAKPLYRDKDANTSRARRLEGFVAATAGEREKALLLFSQAVLRAPAPGVCTTIDRGLSLPLALLGRAEIFMALNEHALALDDLALAGEVDLPDQLKVELDRKMEECKRVVEANQKSLVSRKELLERKKNSRVTESKALPQLSGGENPELPGASALLEIQETAAAGKQAIAKKDISVGDTLVVEAPLAACLLPDYFGTHCHHCFTRLRGPIGCPNCSNVAFCSRTCRDAAIGSYHKYECKILALMIGSGMSVLSTLALRMATQNGLGKCLKICQALSQRKVNKNEEIMEAFPGTEAETEAKLSKSAKRRMRRKKLRESKYGETLDSEKLQGNLEEDRIDLRAYELVTHEKQRTDIDFLERSLMAAFLLKCLQIVGFFENPSKDNEPPSEQEIAVGSLLLKHLQVLQFNAHEFFETRLRTDHRFHGSKPVYLGVAVYPTVSRFNHDCYPAVTRYFVGPNIVIRAIRSLRPGDVIAENYGPIFTKKTLQERQRTLAGRYWFRCQCTACCEDWPTFDTLTNDLVRLRCPTDGCSKVYRKPREGSKPLMCSGCQRKIDLRGQVNIIRDCEELYDRGFKAMDQEQPEKALEAFFQAAGMFHRVAVAPHRDTHLAEIAASACMADAGNTWRPSPL
ncbi:protein-lysine N-methyltransferase SMYD4 [Calliopsis andreniformis]|uniref:protein-lysine N-methyltransferase SMYD4 n=1 Tax=Calliopsis andreniformis TaxID=337506 RepID=UPI003FCE163D